MYLQKDKSIFDLSALPVEAFASSLGLPGAPQIRFVSQAQAKAASKSAVKATTASTATIQGTSSLNKAEPNMAGEKEVQTDLKQAADRGAEESESDESEAETGDEREASTDDEPEESEQDQDELETAPVDEQPQPTKQSVEESVKPKDPNRVRTKYDRMFERKNQGVLAPHFSALVEHDVQTNGGDDDDFLTLAQRDHTLKDIGLDDQELPGTTPTAADMSKRKLKMGESKKAMLKMKQAGHKVVFDDQGEAHEMYEMQGLDDYDKEGEAEEQRKLYVEKNREAMKMADVEDRRVAKEKRQEKKRKRKERERQEASLGL